MVGPPPSAKASLICRRQDQSERRACGIVGADRKMVRYRSCRPPETELRGHCASWLSPSAVRLPTAVRAAAPGGRASGRNRIYRLYREEGLTVRKRRAAAAPWAHERRSWSRLGRTPAGRWTLCTTSSPAGAASGF